MRKPQRASVALIVALLISSVLAACGAAQPSPARSLPTAPGAVEEHFQKGNELFDDGKFEEAAREFEAALEEDPDNVSVLVNLGVAYYNLGNLDGAVESYEEALKLASDDADIHSNLGAAYVQQGEVEAGLQEYQRAVELDPDLAQAYFGLGVIYDTLEQPEEAIAAFTKFQELDEGQDAYASELAQQYLERLKGQ